MLSPPSVLHPRHPEGSSGNPDLAARPHLGPSGAPVILCHTAKPQHWVLPTVGFPGFLRQHVGLGTLAYVLSLGSSWKLPLLPSAWSTHPVQGSQRPRFSPAERRCPSRAFAPVMWGLAGVPEGQRPGLTPPLWKKWIGQSCEPGQDPAGGPTPCWPGLGHGCVLHGQWPGWRQGLQIRSRAVQRGC